MDVRNNIYQANMNPQFGHINNMSKDTRKVFVKGLNGIKEMREYVNLRNANSANPHKINIELNPATNRLYGEIWMPNSNFINFAAYQDKATKNLDFIKSLIGRTINN